MKRYVKVDLESQLLKIIILESLSAALLGIFLRGGNLCAAKANEEIIFVSCERLQPGLVIND